MKYMMKRSIFLLLLVFPILQGKNLHKENWYRTFKQEDADSRAQKTYGDLIATSIVSVYDGDTFRANIEGVHPIIGDNMSIRIYGVDTPEIRGSTPEVKEKAYKARDFTANLLHSAKTITLKNLRRGKYFRFVADVHVLIGEQTVSIAEELLKNGHAVPYTGGTKGHRKKRRFSTLASP